MASESNTNYRIQPVCSAHLYQTCFQGDSDAQVTLEVTICLQVACFYSFGKREPEREPVKA